MLWQISYAVQLHLCVSRQQAARHCQLVDKLSMRSFAKGIGVQLRRKECSGNCQDHPAKNTLLTVEIVNSAQTLI